MTRYRIAICASALVVMAALGSTSAQALTMQECSAKYKAAQTAGTLKGQKWNDFRKTQCGADATPAAATVPAASAPAAPKAAESKPAEPKSAETKPAAPAGAGAAVFPSAVDPKYAK